MNTKAQLGKTMTVFVSIILIVVIMAIFIFLAVGNTIIKGESPRHPSPLDLPYSDPMLAQITLNLKLQPTDLVLIDALALTLENKANALDFKEAITPLLPQDNTCLAILNPQETRENYIESLGYKNSNGQIYQQVPFLPDDSYLKNLKLTINNEPRVISYYYGRCF